MSHSNSSHRNFRSASGGVKSQQQRHQQLACDRCRGQKLRCLRTPDPHAPCERCQKASATCFINPSVRMGRPQRTDKEQREATNSSRKSQVAHSPTPHGQRRTSSQTASKDFAKNGNMWLGHELEDAIDSSLVGVQYQDSIDFELHHAALDNGQLHISPSDDCFDNILDFVSPQVIRNHSDSDMYEFGTEDTSGQLEPSSFASHGSMTTGNVASEKGNAKCISDDKTQAHFPTMQQESVEKVSKLNLELHRQLSIISPMAKEYRNTEPSLVESSDENNILPAAIAFMIQGLQTFHELLLETLGSTNQNFCKDATTHTPMHNPQDNQPLPQHNFWQNTNPFSTSLLSLTDNRDVELLQSMPEPKSKKQKLLQQDAGSKPHIQDRPSQKNWLDISTSLLIISCYINLIYLCRDVFAAIRGSLPAAGQQTNLLTLSGFQISGVSIYQDSDLQIIVLTQAVVRLVDKIGLSLGHPYNSTAETGQKDGAELCSNAILPQLLDFVLRQEGIEGQPFCKGGIEALREEIRRLNKVVYKTV